MVSKFNKIRSSNLDLGPCRISPERFSHLNSIKYQRDLSKLEMADYLSFQFYQSFGYNLDLISPCTFNEKLNWMKVFYHNPLMHICADKAKFHTYVRNKLPGMDEHCVKPLGIYHSVHGITLDDMPDRFVLKSNFGSGAQQFVDKSTAKLDQLKATASKWLDPKTNHYYSALEYSYKDIKPAIICEPIIDFEYKIEFYCFDGRPFIYWTVINDKTPNVRANLYKMGGERLPVSWYYKNFDEDLRPRYFDDLVETAKLLSEGFPHVRVDFYAAKDWWYFSELTFFTWAGMTPFSDYTFDVLLGKQLTLVNMDA